MLNVPVPVNFFMVLGNEVEKSEIVILPTSSTVVSSAALANQPLVMPPVNLRVEFALPYRATGVACPLASNANISSTVPVQPAASGDTPLGVLEFLRNAPSFRVPEPLNVPLNVASSPSENTIVLLSVIASLLDFIRMIDAPDSAASIAACSVWNPAPPSILATGSA